LRSDQSLIQKFDQLMMSVVTPFRRAIDEAITQQQTDSEVVKTAVGPVECAIVRPEKADQGTVFISHTAVGGYDQGVAIARRFPEQRVIAVSRAGYLRTPAETGPTPQHMADAYAALLDALNIERVVMVGLSAGGMAAVSFALQHPDRCGGLILGSAITQPLPLLVQNVLAPISLANQSDFINWLTSRTTATLSIPMRADDEDSRAILQALLNTNPTSHRWQGYQMDMEQARHFKPTLSEIQVPTQIIHGSADVLVPVETARQAADIIPDARLLVIEGGQHDCPVLYPDQVLPVFRRFLSELGL